MLPELGDKVVAMWGPVPGKYGDKDRGVVIGLESELSAIIERPDGTQFHWAGSLIRRQTEAESVGTDFIPQGPRWMNNG